MTRPSVKTSRMPVIKGKDTADANSKYGKRLLKYPYQT